MNPTDGDERGTWQESRVCPVAGVPDNKVNVPRTPPGLSGGEYDKATRGQHDERKA